MESAFCTSGQSLRATGVHTLSPRMGTKNIFRSAAACAWEKSVREKCCAWLQAADARENFGTLKP